MHQKKPPFISLEDKWPETSSLALIQLLWDHVPVLQASWFLIIVPIQEMEIKKIRNQFKEICSFFMLSTQGRPSWSNLIAYEECYPYDRVAFEASGDTLVARAEILFFK